MLFRKYEKKDADFFAKYLRDHSVYGATLVVNAADLTKELIALAPIHGLTICVTLTCVEDGALSVKKVAEKNPAFEELFSSLNPLQQQILVPFTGENDVASVIALASTYEGARVCPIHHDGLWGLYFGNRNMYYESLDRLLTEDELSKLRIEWDYDLASEDIMDINLLRRYSSCQN